MTTSQEHLEWLNGQIPPAEQVVPAVVTAAEYKALLEQAVNYQCAVLQLSAGYAALFRYFRDAMAYLEPKDLEKRPGFREDLIETLDGIQRDLHAQEPVRQAAE